MMATDSVLVPNVGKILVYKSAKRIVSELIEHHLGTNVRID